MHDLAAVILHLEVWKFERRDGVQCRHQRVVDFLPAPLAPQIVSNPPQRSKHLRPIESLTLTVFTEVRHHVSNLLRWLSSHDISRDA